LVLKTKKNSSSVNVQCCYNEFANLGQEYEKQLDASDVVKQLESTTIENHNDEDDQLPDYSVYGDDVNASMLRVLREGEEEEEKGKEQTTNTQDVSLVFCLRLKRNESRKRARTSRL